MDIDSRDSSSLKPAELDEFGQILHSVGLPLKDEDLDRQIELFPLVVLAFGEANVLGFMFGSLERIGGTPSILWGLGAARKGKASVGVVRTMTGELARRAAISFPDEDVLVGTRLAQSSIYMMLGEYGDIVPRPGYNANGEERAWGRRLAKRFGHEPAYDDRGFRIRYTGRKKAIVPVLDGQTIKASGGAKIVELVGTHEPAKGEGMVAFSWAVAEDLASGAFHNPADKPA